jgi:hypothetical protein
MDEQGKEASTNVNMKSFTGLALLLIGLIAGWWLAGENGPAKGTELRAGTAQAGSTIALVEQSSAGGQVMYLVDNNQRTLTVYQYDPGKGKLKLSATRHFGADQQLLEFNNEEPHVADIERLSRSNAK